MEKQFKGRQVNNLRDKVQVEIANDVELEVEPSDDHFEYDKSEEEELDYDSEDLDLQLQPEYQQTEDHPVDKEEFDIVEVDSVVNFNMPRQSVMENMSPEQNSGVI